MAARAYRRSARPGAEQRVLAQRLALRRAGVPSRLLGRGHGARQPAGAGGGAGAARMFGRRLRRRGGEPPDRRGRYKRSRAGRRRARRRGVRAGCNWPARCDRAARRAEQSTATAATRDRRRARRFLAGRYARGHPMARRGHAWTANGNTGCIHPPPAGTAGAFRATGSGHRPAGLRAALRSGTHRCAGAGRDRACGGHRSARRRLAARAAALRAAGRRPLGRRATARSLPCATGRRTRAARRSGCDRRIGAGQRASRERRGDDLVDGGPRRAAGAAGRARLPCGAA